MITVIINKITLNPSQGLGSIAEGTAWNVG